MTYVFIAGELDLSVGSVFGFLTVLMGFLVARNGFDPWIGMVAVVAGGLAIGAMNGAITIGLNIPSFIVTLGSLTAFRSLALILSGQNPATTEGVGLFYDVTGGYIGGTFPWVLIEELHTDQLTGAPLAPVHLDAAGFRRLVDTTRRAAEIVRSEYGLTLVFHSHAETHVQYEDQIEAFLDATEPSWFPFFSTQATMLTPAAILSPS